MFYFAKKEIGGGGAGGRIAIYTESANRFSGTIQTYGGASDVEAGGPGTIYHSDTTPNGIERSLIIDNNKRHPLSPRPPSDLAHDSSRAYIITDDSSTTEYTFERLKIIGGAHLVFDSTVDGEFAVNIGYMDGDGSGVIHSNPKYPVIIADSKSPFPVGFRVVEGTYISFPPGKNDCLYFTLCFVSSGVTSGGGGGGGGQSSP